MDLSIAGISDPSKNVGLSALTRSLKVEGVGHCAIPPAPIGMRIS
jgi:hypothetical protein